MLTDVMLKCRPPPPSFVLGTNGRTIRPAEKENPMRFMMLMYPGPQAETEVSPIPAGDAGQQLLNDMMAFNRRMVEAGILLGGDGLKPTRKGARVKYGGRGSVTVIDGPFTETKEVLGGYWMIQVKSREEAIEWAKRAPMGNNEIIELRQVQEMSDFPEDVQKAAEGFEQMQKQAGQNQGAGSH
jgi:hypothetical protein